MVRATGHSRTPSSVLETISRGQGLREDADAGLRELLGVRVGLEGLSRLFRPSFPGVRPFVIQARATLARAVAFTLVGVDRTGTPVWIGERVINSGIEGGLEIHRGVDELAPSARGRGVHPHSLERELELITLLDGSSRCRLTADGSYRAVLHGFTFADETQEGPSQASATALEPVGDRERLIAACKEWLEEHGELLSPGELKQARAGIETARTSWDIAQLPSDARRLPALDAVETRLGVGRLGKAMLRAPKAGRWRGALYIGAQNLEMKALGDEYRRLRLREAEVRLERELSEALRELQESRNRNVQLRALRELAAIGGGWAVADIKQAAESPDRRVADAARRCLDAMAWKQLPARMLAYAKDEKNPPDKRAHAFRVVAEHFPQELQPMLAKLRVDPDARIQRAAIPVIAKTSHAPAKSLAAMLAANPNRAPDAPRPEVEALRLEVIEQLTLFADPGALLPLAMAYRAEPPPSPAELLALSRALVAIPDPRAQLVLRDVAARLDPPSLP